MLKLSVMLTQWGDQHSGERHKAVHDYVLVLLISSAVLTVTLDYLSDEH